jgi:polyamine oxidase
VCNLRIEQWYSIPLETLSLKNYGYQIRQPDFIFTSSSLDLFHSLITTQSPNITYEMPVTQIQSEGGVIIQTSTGETIEADAVIVTVPLGVLQSGSIKFVPELPSEKLKTISEELVMGKSDRVAMAFSSCFWEDKIENLALIDSDAKMAMYNRITNYKPVSGENILVFSQAGKVTAQVEDLTDEQVRDLILSHLKLMYPDADIQLVGYHVTRWAQDAFTQGSYSFVSQGYGFDAYDRMAEPVHQNIFFAGEHTSRSSP